MDRLRRGGGVVTEHRPEPPVRLELVDEGLHGADVAGRPLEEQAVAAERLASTVRRAGPG